MSDLTALRGQGPLHILGEGTLWLVWSGAGLVSLTQPGGKPPFTSGDGPPIEAVPPYYAEPLHRYFAGHPVDPALIAADLRGTPFQVRVWNALRQVPRGTVRTYAGIAMDVHSPRAVRAVGMANKKNPLPIVVPCHRVIETGNRLGGYSGGLDRKRHLLALENVRVEGDRVLPGQLELWG